MDLVWERGDILGSGGFGVVCRGFLKQDGCSCRKLPVAVKSAAGSCAVQLRREKNLLDHLAGCPQVIRCYGDVTTDEEEEGLGETYNVFLEYAPQGSLRSYLDLRPMHELSARRFVRSMLRGLVHIHSRGVAHCDIKPDNVLLWSSNEVKIIDFGIALQSSEWSPGSRYGGTPSYMAPESVSKNEYGPSGDVWALGCTLAEMLTGKPARAYLGKADLEELALAPPEIPKRMSELGRNFLSRCFEVDTEKRWTAEMLLSHPYMADLDVHDHHVIKPRSSIVSKVLTCLPVIGSCVATVKA